MDMPLLLDVAARGIAAHIVELFELREEERQDAFDEVLARVKAGLESFLDSRRRELIRRYGQPGCN